jgi:hypothetical protein
MWVSSHLLNMGPGCYKLLIRAMSCSALVPHDLTLLGGFDAICNDLGKSSSHICAVIPKGLINLKLTKIHYKVQFHLVTR